MNRNRRDEDWIEKWWRLIFESDSLTAEEKFRRDNEIAGFFAKMFSAFFVIIVLVILGFFTYMMLIMCFPQKFMKTVKHKKIEMSKK